MIEVVPYNPDWPKQFERERGILIDLLQELAIEIYHIGSTAVEGLCAKPKLDIIAVVHDLEDSVQPLEKGGYEFGGELNIPFRYYFKKRGVNPEINLHVYEEGDPEIVLNLAFRDYLRENSYMRNRYAELKQELIKQPDSHEKNDSRFHGYNLGKDSLIKEILNAADFQGLCMRICTHRDEVAAIETFKCSPLNSNTHLVFYRGTEVVGFAEIEMTPSGQAELKTLIATEEEEYFKKRCERWISTLNSQQVKTLKQKLIQAGTKPEMAGPMAKLEAYLEETGKMPSGPKKVRLFHKNGSKTDFTLE